MSAGNFDHQSAVRIGRTVLTVEGSNPVGTKRQRRQSLPPVPGSLQIVRLLEDVPGASWSNSQSNFYDKLSEEVAKTGTALQQLSEGELSSIVASLAEFEFTRKVASGFAVLVDVTIGKTLTLFDGGKIHDIEIDYRDVVRVYNAHPDGFNTSDQGGVFGNEAGALGDGFCTALTGTDGSLWLVNTDRKILVTALTQISNLTDRTSVLDSWEDFFRWYFGLLEDEDIDSPNYPSRPDNPFN